MTDRLTDAELDKVDFVFDGPTGLSMTVRALVAEVREHRAARTLSDEDSRWCEMVGNDARAFPLPTGSSGAAFRDHLLSALAIIDRITEEADRG